MSFWQSTLAGLAAIYPGPARSMAKRWRKAFREDPELVSDLMALGGIYQLPIALDPDAARAGPVDPARLAYEAGQRDLAVRLLALGQIDPRDLNEILETANV